MWRSKHYFLSKLAPNHLHVWKRDIASSEVWGLTKWKVARVCCQPMTEAHVKQRQKASTRFLARFHVSVRGTRSAQTPKTRYWGLQKREIVPDNDKEYHVLQASDREYGHVTQQLWLAIEWKSRFTHKSGKNLFFFLKNELKNFIPRVTKICQPTDALWGYNLVRLRTVQYYQCANLYHRSASVGWHIFFHQLGSKSQILALAKIPSGGRLV